MKKTNGFKINFFSKNVYLYNLLFESHLFLGGDFSDNLMFCGGKCKVVEFMFVIMDVLGPFVPWKPKEIAFSEGESFLF